MDQTELYLPFAYRVFCSAIEIYSQDKSFLTYLYSYTYIANEALYPARSFLCWDSTELVISGLRGTGTNC